MIAIPAIDIRDGACVQLVGGSYADERVRLADPLAVARRWSDAGFRHLHVVDLDAATGCGSNASVVEQLLARRIATVQVGGGVRSDERLDDLFQRGATRVLVGTRALQEPAWLERVTRRWPGAIIAALDVRNGRPATHGWARTESDSPAVVLRRLCELPLAAVLVTAVDVEGQMRGPDLDLIETILDVATVPIIAAGGVATTDDLRALSERGVQAAIIGMALYAGTLDPAQVAAEFNA